MALRRARLGQPVTIRLAIVDDHPVVRDGTAGLFAAQPDVEVVGVGATLEEARAMLAAADPPDVLLLDIQLGAESGLTLLADGEGGHAEAGARRTAIVLLTAFDYPQYAAAALQLGAAAIRGQDGADRGADGGRQGRGERASGV